MNRHRRALPQTPRGWAAMLLVAFAAPLAAALLVHGAAPAGLAVAGPTAERLPHSGTGMPSPVAAPALQEAPQTAPLPSALFPAQAARPALLAVWGGAAAAGLPLLLWVLMRQASVNRMAHPGFEIITPSEARRFIALTEKFQQLDFVSEIKTRSALRVSANLNRVTLSVRRNGYLMEDRNFRNALLVNRRRVRRTLLRDGDVLDLGDLTLLYRDSRPQPPAGQAAAGAVREDRPIIKFERPRGPMRRNTPVLIPEQYPNRAFYLSKNLVFIGHSDMNDLVLKAPSVQNRHAKIERIGGRFKLINLAPAGTTFVNNRRVEQRILKDGDEIALDSQRFTFSFNHKPARERATPQGRDAGSPPAATPPPPNDEAESEEDSASPEQG